MNPYFPTTYAGGVIRSRRFPLYQSCGLRLRPFFRDHRTHSVSRLTPESAEEIYHQHVSRTHFRTGDRLSDATQPGDCKTARAIFRWVTRRGLVLTNRPMKASGLQLLSPS